MRLFRGSNVAILAENFEGSILENNANDLSKLSLTPTVALALNRYARQSANRGFRPLLLDFDVPDSHLFYSRDTTKQDPTQGLEKRQKEVNELVENGVTVVKREFKNWRKRNDDKWTAPFVETKYLENIYIITEKIQTSSFKELRNESKIVRIAGDPDRVEALVKDLT
jgi:hypothetical protein|nr:MAG: hypothetical protein J07AB56_05390 [Candidatus Nanosalinarum sp. J07AB56]